MTHRELRLELLRSTPVAWRIRRNLRLARAAKARCPVCHRWRDPRRFHVKSVICRVCIKGRQ